MERYTFDSAGIAAALNTAERFLDVRKVDRRDALRVRLALEDVLLTYRAALGDASAFVLKSAVRLGRARLILSVPGARIDPFADSGEYAPILRELLSSMGHAPAWTYRDNENVITFALPHRKRSAPAQLPVAIVLASVLGTLSLRLPEAVRVSISVGIVTPVFNAFMGLLSGIAGPMIFLAVVTGVYSVGDAATFSRIGKRLISRFLLFPLLIAVLILLLQLPFYTLSSARVEGGPSALSLVEFILNIVPKNLFAPFVEGNALQIIFIAVAFGLALLLLGEAASALARAVEQLFGVIALFMQTICRFVPAIVFCAVFTMISDGKLAALKSIVKAPLLMLPSLAIVGAIFLFKLCAFRHMSPRYVLKKILPGVLIAFSTASSSAALAVNLETCEKGLGMDRKLVHFGIPLGQVMFKPGTVAGFITLSLCMAEAYGVPITPSMLFTAVIVACVITIATPPVSGAGVTSLAMLFAYLQIPAEAVAMIVAVNVILDYPRTAINNLCLQCELISIARAGGTGRPRSAGRQ